MPADFFCSHRLVLSGVILGRVLLLIWENSDRIEHMIRLWLYNILRELLKNRAAFAEKKHAQFCMWRAREVFSLLLSRFWENILLFDEVIQTHFLCMCCNVDISMEYELQIRQMLHFQSPFIIISFIFLLFIFLHVLLFNHCSAFSTLEVWYCSVDDTFIHIGIALPLIPPNTILIN